MNRHYTEYGERISSEPKILTNDESIKIAYSMLKSMPKNEMDEYLNIKSAKRMAVISQQWPEAACHRDTEKEIEKKLGIDRSRYGTFKYITDDMIVNVYGIIKLEEQREEQINKILNERG